jgi:hypothetical protein
MNCSVRQENTDLGERKPSLFLSVSSFDLKKPNGENVCNWRADLANLLPNAMVRQKDSTWRFRKVRHDRAHAFARFAERFAQSP